MDATQQQALVEQREQLEAARAAQADAAVRLEHSQASQEQMRAFLQDARIRQPSLFVVGEKDPVRHYAGPHEAGLKDWLTDLRGQHVLPGAGHWLQQERPDEVNRLLLAFLRGL